MNGSAEEWRPVPDHEGFYEVSNLGRVRSLDRTVDDGKGHTNTLRGALMKQHTRPNGYRFVTLTKDAKRAHWAVHRLVAFAFIGDLSEHFEVCHNDGVKANNQASNLRWDTRSANIFDLVKHGRHPHAKKTHCNRGHLLAANNLTPAGLRQGKRLCLACSRAQSVCRRMANPDMQAVSDSYYADLLRAG